MSYLCMLLILPLTLVGLLAASETRGEELTAQPETHWAAAVPQWVEPDPPGANRLYAPAPPAEGLAAGQQVPLQPPETPRTEAAGDPRQARGVPPLLAPYPVIVNEWVRHFLTLFQAPSHREPFSLWLNRSGRYLEMIQNVFRMHGLPEELAYMAMIESGFNPVAVSRAGAKGLWQFMEQTARRYGLRVDRWVDERLDPEKSTVAAALYLRDLFGQFGSWFLAKAAYNAGELKVTQAVQRSRSNDFWTLTRGRLLREETKRFVPAILAATLIGQNPRRYGFEVTAEPPLAYDLVTAPPLLGLKRLGARAGISVEELLRLNSELRHGVTPPGGPYPLKVPSGSGTAVQMVLAETQSVRVGGAVHVVNPRETVGAIAKRYSVSVADLVRWNGLSDASRIFPRERLRVAESR